MSFRLAAAALVLLAGCTWESRPDGGHPRHTENHPDPLTRAYDETDPVQPLQSGTVVEPLDASGTAGPTGAGAAPNAMPLAPGAPTPTDGIPSLGSAAGDGAATGPGPAAPGTSGAPTP